MSQHRIERLDDPRLEPYRDLKRTNRTRDGSTFIAEGAIVVARLLASDYTTLSVLASERRLHAIAETVPEEVDLLVVPQEIGEQLVGFNFHAGIMACGAKRPAPSLEDVAGSASAPSLLVACSRVDNPDNLGAIIRMCAAFGVNGLLLGPGCADPFSRRVLRVSMGTAFALPVVPSDELLRDISMLRARGYEVLATVPRDGRSITETLRPSRLMLVLGNEAAGLSTSEIAACSDRVRIPLDSGADSLNVAAAAAIFLYHFSRGAGNAE